MSWFNYGYFISLFFVILIAAVSLQQWQLPPLQLRRQGVFLVILTGVPLGSRFKIRNAYGAGATLYDDIVAKARAKKAELHTR